MGHQEVVNTLARLAHSYLIKFRSIPRAVMKHRALHEFVTSLLRAFEVDVSFETVTCLAREYEHNKQLLQT